MGHKAQDVMVGTEHGLAVTFMHGKNEYVANVEVDEGTGNLKVNLNNAKLLRGGGEPCPEQSANIVVVKRKSLLNTPVWLGMGLLAIAIAVIAALRF